MCRLSSIAPAAVCLFQMTLRQWITVVAIVRRDDVISDMRSVQYRKWSPTANDPQTANAPQNGPEMILDRK